MKDKCDICKERKFKIIFFHTLEYPIVVYRVCFECEVNLMIQYYGLLNKEVEEFIDENLKFYEKIYRKYKHKVRISAWKRKKKRMLKKSLNSLCGGMVL